MLGASAPLGAARLQNLAWLDQNGNVQSIKQQNGMGVLGAAAPFQHLAWLGENG